MQDVVLSPNAPFADATILNFRCEPFALRGLALRGRVFGFLAVALTLGTNIHEMRPRESFASSPFAGKTVDLRTPNTLTRKT